MIQPRERVIDRIPPHNLEAEMAVLGALLVDKKVFEAVVDTVEPGDFYAHVHETIYDVMLDLYRHDAPLDKITVAEELRKRDSLQRVGGLPYLSALMDTVQTAASATYYATIVHEKAILRGLIHAGGEIAGLGFEGEEDVRGALDHAQRKVLDLGTRAIENTGTHTSDVVRRIFARLESGQTRGLSTGLRYVDEHYGGLRPDTLYILAARPGMGKTTLALKWATSAAHQAAEEDLGRVEFFSIEMSEDEIVGSALASLASIDRRIIRDGGLRDNQWVKLHGAMTQLVDMPLYFHEDVTTVEQIRARCRRTHQRHRVAAIFVDYLQLLRSGAQRWNNKNEELAEVSRSLKLLSRELHVPVIVLAQLNRNIEHRANKGRPTLSDLRDSGAIEADADVVSFVYRPVAYDNQADPYAAELITEKQRLGVSPATIPLRFVPEFVRFEDADAI